MQIIGQLFVMIVVSVFFGFIFALIFSLVYYRFKWLDPDEEDRPEFDALDFGVGMQISLHIISEKLLPSKYFYFLGIILSAIIFLILVFNLGHFLSPSLLLISEIITLLS